MPTEVILPKVDMDMSTGRISRWFFESGATVNKGDVLFEIETDKAAMEIDAPASGTLGDITGAVGVDIAVGAPVAWIYEQGEAISKPPAVSIPQPPVPLPAVIQPLPTASQDTPQTLAKATRATPLARRLARLAGVDISNIAGTGPNGRITRSDVEQYRAAAEPSVSVPAATEVPKADVVASSAHSVSDLFRAGSYDLIPHSNMRRTIARRLVEAKTTVPHFYLSIDCNIDALLRLRSQLNSDADMIDGKPDYKLSVNDMVIKAYAMALRKVPGANVSWTDAGLLQHKSADIGVAVSVPGGLITPIVRNAETKTLSAISHEMKDLGARARDGKLKSDEYQGGTGAVSNLGMFGISEFAAIVNPPHATILAVGAGERRPVAIGDDVGLATMMRVTLSTDHRAVDGALAAELAGAFRSFIERPMSMMV